MKVSVVIPAHNEEQSMPACLDALVIAKYEDAEIIIVDNNSTDKTQQIANTYKNKLNLRVIKETKKGRGAARARGFQEAHGDIVFSTDADTTVPNNWIPEMLSGFTDDSIVAVSGSCEFSDVSLFTRLIMKVFLPIGVYGYRIMFGHFWLSGFNFAIKKTAYVKSGGFNSNLNALEDVDLGRKVRKVGTIKYVFHPAVVTSGRRFSGSPILGPLSYISTFIGYYFSKGSEAYMDDVR